MILNEGLDKFLESVKPQKISYGTNPETDNGEFFNQNGIIGTFFNYDGLYYAVTLDNASSLTHIVDKIPSGTIYEIQFGTSVNFTQRALHYTIDSSSSNTTNNAIKAFSHILYVLREIIDHIGNVDFITLNGFGEDHQKLYALMVSSRLLRREVEKGIKYKYMDEVYGYYIFQRIH